MLEHQRVAVIRVDDASRDDTVSIAHTLGSHIILHLGEEHWHFALARIDHQACGNRTVRLTRHVRPGKG